MKPITKTFGFAFAVSTLSLACATRTPPPDPTPVSENATEKAPIAQAPDPIAKLQERIQDLEIRLSALNDKINLENGGQPPVAKTEAPKEAVKTVITPPAAHARAIPNFVQDEAVDRYREAKILFDSKRHADAIVEFSNFIKTYPDHTLNAAAQFYIGMGYFEQGEFKLAEEEFSRGLLSYPHSEYIPDTLLALTSVSSKLKKPARVEYFKQKLLSAFPNSPQAKGISLESAVSEIETPSEPTPPTAPVASSSEEKHE